MEFILFIIALGIGSWQIFNWMYSKKLRDNKETLKIRLLAI